MALEGSQQREQPFNINVWRRQMYDASIRRIENSENPDIIKLGELIVEWEAQVHREQQLDNVVPLGQAINRERMASIANICLSLGMTIASGDEDNRIDRILKSINEAQEVYQGLLGKKEGGR